MSNALKARDLRRGGRHPGSTLRGARVLDRDLSGLHLEGATLHQVTFSGVDLEGASFRGATLSECRFRDCEMLDVSFAGASLKELHFESSRMARVDFTDAQGQTLSLRDCAAADARFVNALITQLSLEGTLAMQARFEGATLRRFSATEATLSGASFLRAKLDRPRVIDSDFERAELIEAHLSDALFRGGEGVGADFSSAVFEGACTASHVDLRGARFLSADIRALTFTSCTLDGADFTDARRDDGAPRPAPPQREHPNPRWSAVCATCGTSIELWQEGVDCAACGTSPLLEGRYLLLENIGSGTMGMTFRAFRLTNGERVAIKELSIRKVDALKTLELFEREARVLRSLSHPGIPRYIETIQQDAGKHTSIFLVQELIEGETLEAEMAHTRHDEAAVLGILYELLGIVGYLHGLQPAVIHRDIKPSNIMRRADRKGALVLLDFGAVREAVRERGAGSTVAGTFGFMAPEQFAGIAVPATDIYALGALAIALLSRRPLTELLDSNNRLDWAGVVPVSRPVRKLLGRMLAPEHADRPVDTDALREEIRTLPVGRGEFVTTRPKTQRGLGAVAAATGGAALGGALLVTGVVGMPAAVLAFLAIFGVLYFFWR